jgi:hypothetical protein
MRKVKIRIRGPLTADLPGLCAALHARGYTRLSIHSLALSLELPSDPCEVILLSLARQNAGQVAIGRKRLETRGRHAQRKNVIARRTRPEDLSG